MTAPIFCDGSTNLTPYASWHNASGSTFALADRMGSTKVGTDSTGATTLTRDFDAYGNFIGVTGASYLPWGFAGSSGYWEESESLLKQVGHRYYDPSTGRFLTRDHAKDGRNWYAYCDNNPGRYVDEDGQFVLIVLFGVGLIAGGVYAYIVYTSGKSEEQYQKHLRGNRQNKQRIDQLQKQLGKSGGKLRKILEQEIEDLLDKLKGHMKETKQKWPDRPSI